MEEIILRANGSVTKKPPLLAGFGFVVERGGQIVERGAGIVVTDRPTAYTAILGSVVAGLETLGELMPYICPPPRVVVAMSHWVVCEQVTRRRAHEPEHQVLVERAGMLIDGLKAAGCPVDLVKVSREKGLAALKLARQAIEVESHSEAPLAPGPGQDAPQLVSVDVGGSEEELTPAEPWQLAEQDLARALGGVWACTVGQQDTPKISIDGLVVCNVKRRRRPAWILSALGLIRRQAAGYQLPALVLDEDGEEPIVVMALSDFKRWVLDGAHSYSDRRPSSGGSRPTMHADPRRGHRPGPFSNGPRLHSGHRRRA